MHLNSFKWTSLFWPLMLAPLHWVNYQLLQGNHWGYGGMIAGAGFQVAFVHSMEVVAI